MPLQVPPHGELPWFVQVRVPCGMPAGTVVQVPNIPGTSHAWHAEVSHAELQQYPSTQLPLVHWVDVVQARPFGSVPHEPPTQLLLAEHCAWVVQLLKHWVAS